MTISISKNRLSEVRIIDGKICIKILGMPAGLWHQYDYYIDSLMDHVRRELGEPLFNNTQLCVMAGLQVTNISRYRNNIEAITPNWLISLYDLSGIPINELRAVAGLSPYARRYPTGRKETKTNLVPK